MRKDLYLSRLNHRPATGYGRIWVEDSSRRLSRNGFLAGMSFTAVRRLGPGVILRAVTIGDYTVSHRRNTPILSLENRMIAEAFPSDDLLVKISFGLISVVPSVRAFSVRVANPGESWEIRGGAVVTPRGTVAFGASPVHPSGRPEKIDAEITDGNLIAATELIAWAKPVEIRVRGNGLAVLTATQFLKSCGWNGAGEGLLRR